MAEAPKTSNIYVHTRPPVPEEEEIPLPPGVKEPEIINIPNALNSPTTNLPQYTFDEMMQKDEGKSE